MADADRLDIDFEGAQDPFAAVPEDNYGLQVTKAEFTKSQSSGNRMVAIEYEILGGEYAGKKLFDNAVLEGKGSQFGVWRLKQLAFAGGVPYSDLADAIREQDLSLLLGVEIENAQVTQEPRNDNPDRMQNRVELLVEPE